MKTNISNFFVLVVIFLLGWFLVFCFFDQKTETRFFFDFQIGEGKKTPTQERARKYPESHLGLFSNDLTL